MNTLPERISILIVDDDDVASEAVVRALRQHGLRNAVVCAGDGHEALEIMKARHPTQRIARPYLVLLDLKMPGMDGFEFLEAVRANPFLRETVVFAFSTSDDPCDIANAYRQNVAGYVVKGEHDRSYAAISALLERYEAAVRLPA